MWLDDDPTERTDSGSTNVSLVYYLQHSLAYSGGDSTPSTLDGTALGAVVDLLNLPTISGIAEDRFRSDFDSHLINGEFREKNQLGACGYRNAVSPLTVSRDPHSSIQCRY